MQNIRSIAFLLLAALFAACTTPVEKKLLKWGSYTWEIQVDTLNVVDTIMQINPVTLEETIVVDRYLDTTWKLKDTAIHNFQPAKAFTDTIYQINPTTLAEEMVIRRTDALPYNTDAGKISLEDFHKLLLDSAVFQPATTRYLCNLQLQVVSHEGYAQHWWTGDPKAKFEDLGIGRGDKVFITLSSCKGEGNRYYLRDAGIVLFEII